MKRFLILFLCNTWGIIMTLIGYITRFVLLCKGVKGEKTKIGRVYYVGQNWGGICLGTTILISSDDRSKSTLEHEMGHTVQNAMFGVLFPFLIGLPSLIWCHCFENYRRQNNIGYYDIWFEGQASRFGKNLHKD